MRPAQAGDVCILLEPSADELSYLRAYQRRLQAVFGGQLVEHVHVTCQRYRPDASEHLTRIVYKMVDELASVEPFPLLPASVVTLQSEFWETSLARWTVQETDAWRSLIAVLNRTLQELSCPPHYQGDWPPTCGALEHIAPGQPLLGLDEALPQVLFEARTAVLSQVEGQGRFTLLKKVTLGSGKASSSAGGQYR